MTRIHYLEIVTLDVDASCATYSSALGVSFQEPNSVLGNAKIAELADGSMLGVRPPMHPAESPVTRPYWLVDDINAALASAIAAGGQLALSPMDLPGYGTCAIYFQGGVQHGLWQL